LTVIAYTLKISINPILNRMHESLQAFHGVCGPVGLGRQLYLPQGYRLHILPRTCPWTLEGIVVKQVTLSKCNILQPKNGTSWSRNKWPSQQLWIITVWIYPISESSPTFHCWVYYPIRPSTIVYYCPAVL